MLFKNSVRTSKRTPYFTITKINWLTLFKKIIAVYSENRTKSISTKYRVIVCKSRWYIWLPLGFKGLRQEPKDCCLCMFIFVNCDVPVWLTDILFCHTLGTEDGASRRVSVSFRGKRIRSPSGLPLLNTDASLEYSAHSSKSLSSLH
jgi:hypothetical protein